MALYKIWQKNFKLEKIFTLNRFKAECESKSTIYDFFNHHENFLVNKELKEVVKHVIKWPWKGQAAQKDFNSKDEMSKRRVGIKFGIPLKLVHKNH